MPQRGLPGLPWPPGVPNPLRPLSSLVPRVSGLLDRVGALLDRIDRTIDRVNDTEAQAAAVVIAVDDLQRRAEGVVLEQQATLSALGREAEQWLPVLARLRVALDPVLANWEPADSATVLDALHSLGPDLTQLVALSRGLNELVGTLPGLGKVKRRVDEEVDERTDEHDARVRAVERSSD